MSAKRTIEVFSPGCPACNETADLVNRVACSSCDVSVLDMNDPSVARRATSLGIRSAPAVVIVHRAPPCRRQIAPQLHSSCDCQQAK